MLPYVALMALSCAMLGGAASAQTLVMTEGVQTFSTLSNMTVAMSNRCELRITSPNTPLTGCIIDLTSPDTCLVLPGIKPSVVVSTYLGQVRVSGAVAVADSNCRVVEYAMGAIVLPHATSFQPLMVFSAPHFTGNSASLNQWTLYNTAAELGAMNRTIGSFKLKRGYMAVFAQYPDGTGTSRSYIAQDGDLKASVMPPGLQNAMFVRVMPWRWTSKKSIAGDPGNNLLNLQSWYNWDVGASSTRDFEYVGIKQNAAWPSLNQDWQGKQVNTLLGFNEPDQANQANMTVDAAISQWPELLGTGLRIGSPAPSDGGYGSWLYPFMDEADGANLRVDFTAVHYYRCTSPVSDANAAATQMYNALKGIYDRTKRPIWITEWNNGANWTGCGDPTYAQQQAAISAMITMLDNTPWVERYALYSWVEEVRQVTTNGVLTPAGVTYRDKQSPVGYLQSFPDNGTRSLAQLRFDGDALDSSGCGNNGVTAGCPAYTNGYHGRALVFDGANSVVTLPVNVARSNAFTFAAWINWAGGANWQRIFDFGNSATHYMFLSPSASGSNLRFAIANGGSEQQVNAPTLASGTWVHVAVTLSGSTARIYTNGVLAAQNTGMTISPASFAPRVNFLGKSQFADPLFKGLVDDVLITDSALSATQIAALLTNTPPAFTNATLSGGTATQGVVYNGSIAGTAADADPGDNINYSKASGPAWLTVAANGTLSGTPTMGDGGTNEFTVMATDSAGATASAVVVIALPAIIGDGTWSVASSGLWSDASKWSGNFPANGAYYTADFSTLNIGANLTVTLDGSRSIGRLKFGDTSGGQTWTITNNISNSTLTLDTGMSTIVSQITVNQNTATLAVPLINQSGVQKLGTGTLVLSASNALGGTLYVDTGSTINAEGAVRAAHPQALAGLAEISIRNNSGASASSTLQLDGSQGGVMASAPLSLSGRNSSVPAVQNLSGTNTLSGTTTINVGGGSYIFQSDAGMLNLGNVTSSATGSRTLTFQGNGNHGLIGVIGNGSATTVNITKSGSGTMTLTGGNTYAGTTTITSGTLQVGNGGATGTLGLGNTLNNASLAFNRPNAVSYGFNISGSGSVTKLGAGPLTLGGSNTYSGSTIVSAGTLNLGGPLLRLSFDNVGGATVTNDGAGGAALNGTITGSGATIAAGGHSGNGLSIGSGAVNAGYVRINDAVVNFDVSGSWTWGMWIKTTTPGAAYLYQGAGGWASGNSSFYLNSGGTTAGTKGGGVRWGQNWQTGTATLNDGTWHFIAMTCNAGTKVFYVDGAVDAWASDAWTGSGTGNQLWIGGTADIGDGNVRMNGMIDDVVVFDRALAQSELVNLINGSASASAAIPPTSLLTIASGATLNLNGSSARLNGLNGSGSVDTSGLAPASTLTLSNTGSATFNGVIKNTGGKLSLVKSGSGTQILNGTNQYAGTTTVSGGVLLVNGSLATNTVNVVGGILGGNGIISGATTLQSGATISPGASTGTLTFGRDLTFLAGSTVVMEINADLPTNDLVRVTNTLTYGGALTVNNLAGTPAAGQSFFLFDAGAYTGSFTATNLPALPGGLEWHWSPTNGTLSVIAPVAFNPTNLTYSVSNDQLMLSWPSEHTGWRLQMQTNTLATGLGVDWIDVPGSELTNRVTLPVDSNHGSAFFRLTYP
jgi:autotransporter-associated beta strand protein